MIQEETRGHWKALAELIMGSLWKFISVYEGQPCLKIPTIYHKGSQNISQAVWSLTEYAHMQQYFSFSVEKSASTG